MIARMVNLVRGIFGQWVLRGEHRNPAAVYQAAIDGRVEQYSQLRQAAAGVLYMRSKLAKELEAKTADLARVERELEHALGSDDDEVALALLRRRDGLRSEIERVRGEVAEVNAEAEAAKRNLITFQDEIGRLRDEKVRMVAKWANARARRRFQETMRGLSLDADIRALEEVREYVQRAVGEANLNGELGTSAVEQRLERLREAEAMDSARAELARLRRARGASLLPIPVAAA